MTRMHIRLATPDDRDAIWRILEPIIRAGETYALPRDMTKDDALAYWMGDNRETFVAVADDEILGTYYLRANQLGGGAHVGNCGYVTAEVARGRGIARSMCEHSQELARERGFRAMQFNLVVASNEGAVKLWQTLGFAIVSRLPGAFSHPKLGYTDAFVMFKALSGF